VNEAYLIRKLVLPLFAAAWTSGICYLDARTAGELWRAGRSWDWPTAGGVVTRSELADGDDPPALTYTFAVGGREYAGHEYEPDPHLTMGNPWEKVAAELPVGTSVTVAYDPDDPADATLRPGLRPDMLRAMFILAPFSVAAVGVVCLAWVLAVGPRQFKARRDVRPTPTGCVARLNDVSPWLVVGMLFYMVTFLTGFLLMGVPAFVNKSDEVPASWWLDGPIWLAILGATVWFARQAPTPRQLELREATLTLPDTPTGPATVDLFRSAVRGVEVRADTRPSGRNPEPITVYQTVLLLDVTDGRREVCFAAYPDRRDAEALANWLRNRLNLHPTAANQLPDRT
jgi:hypothetical protein